MYIMKTNIKSDGGFRELSVRLMRALRAPPRTEWRNKRISRPTSTSQYGAYWLSQYSADRCVFAFGGHRGRVYHATSDGVSKLFAGDHSGAVKVHDLRRVSKEKGRL